MTPQTVPPFMSMLQMLHGLHFSTCISCLAQLGIPDLVEAGPRSAEELAAQVGAQPQALYRLMRATASIGILAEGADGKFSETPLSAVLRSNAKPSARSFAMMGGREWHMRGWERLEYTVRTGKTALDEVYGMAAFEYLFSHPAEMQIFSDAMTEFSMMDSPAVAEAYSFDGIRSIVDVGGGHGLLLANILRRNPHMRGTLYEVPPVIEGARNGPLLPLMDRCTLTSGDMFTSVPGGADAYIMKHIIHDWPDEVCVKILTACRQGVNPGGKLLVADSVIQPGNEFSIGKIMDIQMMLFPGGRERTEEQFRELLAASGWRLNRIISTAASESIVEGVPI
jgi:hypothetical protein